MQVNPIIATTLETPVVQLKTSPYTVSYDTRKVTYADHLVINHLEYKVLDSKNITIMKRIANLVNSIKMFLFVRDKNAKINLAIHTFVALKNLQLRSPKHANPADTEILGVAATFNLNTFKKINEVVYFSNKEAFDLMREGITQKEITDFRKNCTLETTPYVAPTSYQQFKKMAGSYVPAFVNPYNWFKKSEVLANAEVAVKTTETVAETEVEQNDSNANVNA